METRTPVRRAAWGNGLMATPGTAPRADSTKGKEANLAIIRPARSAASRTVKLWIASHASRPRGGLLRHATDLVDVRYRDLAETPIERSSNRIGG